MQNIVQNPEKGKGRKNTHLARNKYIAHLGIACFLTKTYDLNLEVQQNHEC